MSPLNPTSRDSPAPGRTASLPGVLRLAAHVLGEDLRAQSGTLGLTALVIALWSAAMILAPVIAQRIVDEAIPNGDVGLMARLAAALALDLVAATAFLYLQGRLGVTACEAIMLGVRRKLMEKILAQAWNLSNRFGSADLVARFAQDTELVAESLGEILVRSIMGSIYPLMLLAYLLAWNWRFGLIALAVLPGYALYYAVSQRVLSRASGPARGKLAGQTAVSLDLVAGAREIRVFQQEARSRKRFSEASEAYSRASTAFRRKLDASRTWMDMLGIAVAYMPVVIGGFMILGGGGAGRGALNPGGGAGLTVGMLLACFTHLRLLTMRLTLIFYGVAGLANVTPSLARIGDVLDSPDPPPAPPVDLATAPSETTVEFVDLSYRLDSGEELFSGLNLRIGQGEKVAITGPSGSGKSTLLDLLLRLRAPSGGKILLGGRDITSYSLPFYLSYFSWVGQATHLFHLSVGENISMGWHNVPESVIRDATARVRLDEAVMRLPQGYATVLGGGGASLSGGQAQRLALARAIVRDPAVLVLDEFTSAMDREVEKEILDDLFAVSAGRTVICVTHSPGVASRFDRVIGMESLAARKGIRT